MRLSTKGRYATRCMLELALNYGKGNMLLKDVARRQELSLGYLEHIVPPLKAAGLIHASRGARGGYHLAKKPSEITLKEIILLMEGSISPVEHTGSQKASGRVHYSAIQDVWKELGDKISDTLEAVTLQDLVRRQKEKSDNKVFYHI